MHVARRWRSGLVDYQNSTLEENWNGNNADLLQLRYVPGLGNATLDMFGNTPPTKGQYVDIIQCLNGSSSTGNFATFLWYGHPGTSFSDQEVPDGGNGFFYQIAQNSQ